MGNYLLSLYVGSLFLLVFIVSPVLLRTPKNKDLAGHFYGRILWRFYYTFGILLLIYTLLIDFVEGFILLFGLGLNVALSSYMKKFKRSLGNIENYEYDHPLRVKFRRLSYTSLTLLSLNFVISSLILITNFRGG